jgi:hypothetical protein
MDFQKNNCNMKKWMVMMVLTLGCWQSQAQQAGKEKASKRGEASAKHSGLHKPDTAAMAKMKAANMERAAKTQFDYFIIKADSSTYGYSIYANGNLYIQQNTIPGMPGNKGFADTTSCGQVARLAIQKIRQGEMPPAITPEELKKTVANSFNHQQ